MVREYSLRSSQRRKYILFPLMKLLAVCVIGTIIGIGWFDIRQEQLLMGVSLTWAWFFLIHVLPLVVMAVRHSQASMSSYFAFDTLNKIYEYREKDKSLSFRLSEIDKVIKVVSPPKYDNRVDLLGFAYFFYWKIVLLDGTVLSISCMLCDVDEFSGAELRQEKRMFPVPSNNQRVMEVSSRS